MVETHIKPDFLGKKFCPQNWENGPKIGQKQGFLNLLKNLVIDFYWICSIMKTYIICCVPVQIPCLWEFFFVRYGPKCSQPTRLQDFLINHISRTNPWNSLFFSYLYKFIWTKSWSKIFGCAWSKMCVASHVMGLWNWLYLKKE